MRTRRAFHSLIIVAAVALLVTAPSTLTAMAPAVKVGAADIGGVVTSAHGPEAGVWVIARTDDLPTRYTKIVVTDDQGRYLIPDLPAGAGYTVWSRGYGLVDGPHVHAVPGKLVNLRATLAPNAKAAAQYYPAEYWFSLLKIPDASDFPGTGPKGNGIGTEIKNQQMWIDQVKTDGCETCHQLGNKYTRTLPTAFGTFPNHAAVWQRRVESGQAGPPDDLDRGPHRTASVRKFCRLDRSHRCRRDSQFATGTAGGHRTQHRDHRMGLVVADHLYARRDLDGQTESAAQRVRQDLRLVGREQRFHAGARSDPQFDELGQGAGARSGHAVVRLLGRRETAHAVGVLGQSAHLAEPDDRAQSDARRKRPRLDDRAHPARRRSRVLQSRLVDGVRASLPAHDLGPAVGRVRPEDRRVQARELVLRHAPSVLDRRRQGHDVVHGQPRRRRLARHQSVSAHGRCVNVARLDAVHRRHDRHRETHRSLDRTRRTARSGQRCAHPRQLLRRRHQRGRRLDLGLRRELSGR